MTTSPLNRITAKKYDSSEMRSILTGVALSTLISTPSPTAKTPIRQTPTDKRRLPNISTRYMNIDDIEGAKPRKLFESSRKNNTNPNDPTYTYDGNQLGTPEGSKPRKFGLSKRILKDSASPIGQKSRAHVDQILQNRKALNKSDTAGSRPKIRLHRKGRGFDILNYPKPKSVTPKPDPTRSFDILDIKDARRKVDKTQLALKQLRKSDNEDAIYSIWRNKGRPPIFTNSKLANDYY